MNWGELDENQVRYIVTDRFKCLLPLREGNEKWGLEHIKLRDLDYWASRPGTSPHPYDYNTRIRIQGALRLSASQVNPSSPYYVQSFRFKENGKWKTQCVFSDYREYTPGTGPRGVITAFVMDGKRDNRNCQEPA